MVVMIQGGLGNQMFGYAFAKALETRLNTAIYLYPTGYTPNKNRKFELDIFNISLNIFNDKDMLNFFKKNDKLFYFIEKYSKCKFIKFLKKITPKPLRLFTKRHYKYLIMDNDKLYEMLKHDIYNNKIFFIGYFQNLNYFKTIRNVLLKDFTLKMPLDSKNIETKN